MCVARNQNILVILLFITFIQKKTLQRDQHKNTYIFVAAGEMEKHTLILLVVHHPGLELDQEE